MAQFSKPAGMTEPNRPAATTNGPGSYDAPNTKPMVTGKPFNPIGADGVKPLAQAGQTLDKIGVTVVTAKPTPAGDDGNVASGDLAGGLPAVNIIGPGRPGVQEPTRGKTPVRPRSPINPAFVKK